MADERFEAGSLTYSVTLPQWEGPLDLLLHLIQKHELDILDIPIAFITSKYLEYLSVMQLMNLDVAAEYLVMAATLAHIKSKMLLPQVPEDQRDDGIELEEEDPRESLIRRLLEYQKYKQAAAELQSRGLASQDVFGRGAPVEEAVVTGLAPLAEVELFSLVEAFQRVLESSKVKLTHDIVADRISLSDRINQIVDLLKGKGRIKFEELFAGMTTRFDLVITFLALLEMTKLRMTRLFQDESLGPIQVELADGALDHFVEDGDPFAPVPPPDTDSEPDAPLPLDDASEDLVPHVDGTPEPALDRQTDDELLDPLPEPELDASASTEPPFPGIEVPETLVIELDNDDPMQAFEESVLPPAETAAAFDGAQPSEVETSPGADEAPSSEDPS